MSVRNPTTPSGEEGEKRPAVGIIDSVPGGFTFPAPPPRRAGRESGIFMEPANGEGGY